MALKVDIFLLLEVGIGVLALANIILVWYFYITNKRINTLLENGKIKEFKSIILAQNAKNNDLEEKLGEAFLKIKILENIAKKTIQKTSVVRFDPFKGMSGKQSFVVAFLDDENTGFVISSLFVKESNRVFAKAIKNGKSEYLLSEEEKKAIEKAITRK